MSISYTNTNNSKRIKEPLFQRQRVKYKGPRSSQLENVETNMLQLDFRRILIELDNTDIKVLDNITYFTGDKSLITEQVKLEDGLSSEISSIEVYIDSELAIEETLVLDSMDKLSSKLVRLLSKVKRLEIVN